MGNYQTYSKTKAFGKYGSKIRKRKTFDLIRKAQKLTADITSACAIADRNYRLTICQDVRIYARNLLHMLRYANARNLGDYRRAKMQHDAAEMIEKLYDEIPVLRYCGCITPQKEGEIELGLLYVKAAFENWIRSDYKRIIECKESTLKQKREANENAYKKVSNKVQLIIYDYFPDEEDEKKTIDTKGGE